MEKTRTRKVILLGIVLFAVLITSVAFAAIQSELNLKGTAQLKADTFNVQFTNLSSAALTGNATETQAPTLANYAIQTFKVEFTQTGDAVSYTFVVENTGDMDAKIGTLNIGTPSCSSTDTTFAAAVCADLTYTLTYLSDGSAVALGDELDAGDDVTMVLTLSYLSGSAPAQATGVVDISNLDVQMIYVQN
ncbi:MAG: hypothetical protein GX758_00545 [Tenericutes bacterium]|nr:hypothetical protein [Mycoplasmatota bacterium]